MAADGLDRASVPSEDLRDEGTHLTDTPSPDEGTHLTVTPSPEAGVPAAFNSAKDTLKAKAGE